MQLAYKVFDLPLRHVFTISRGSTSIQPTLIVQIEHQGEYGYGEATTNRYYNASAAEMAAAIERVRHVVESADPHDIDRLLQELALQLHDNSFALAALDLAIHDLWAKLAGRPLYAMWGLGIDQVPQSDYTIGIDTIDNMVAKLREMPGWPVYKIKLGGQNDLAAVKALRAETDALFRVDANCGWTAEQAIDMSHELRPLGVEFIEQPLPADDTAGAERLFAEAALPIIADESCVVEADVDRCAGRFHGINVKLVKCGGLAPARRMIARARELGMQTMVGCMTESTVGISAIAQLLPLLDYVDMDGAVLLAEDIAEGVVVAQGECRFAEGPGTGAKLLGGPLPHDCRDIATEHE
jgi:L-alanine-DL-glutamate epimerase-like enolase superfamily enzyme